MTIRTRKRLQTGQSMQTQTYTGMGSGFQTHDAFATGSQGAVQDRTQEHVVSSDIAIVAARKLMEKAIRDIQEGREPPHVIRTAEQNNLSHVLVISDLLSGVSDWKVYTQTVEKDAHIRHEARGERRE